MIVCDAVELGGDGEGEEASPLQLLVRMLVVVLAVVLMVVLAVVLMV